jgi:hypothetical protein
LLRDRPGRWEAATRRRKSPWRLSPLPFASLPVVASGAALDHLVAPLIARHDEGSKIATAEANRAERDHDDDLRQQLAHDLTPDINRKAGELAYGGSELIGLPLPRPIFNYYIAPLDITKFGQSLPEMVPDRRIVDDADARNLPLLCARNERPRDRSATNYLDEIAPSHCLAQGRDYAITAEVYGRRNRGRPSFCGQQFQAVHVRFGSKADIAARASYVRFAPKSGHR